MTNIKYVGFRNTVTFSEISILGVFKDGGVFLMKVNKSSAVELNKDFNQVSYYPDYLVTPLKAEIVVSR